MTTNAKPSALRDSTAVKKVLTDPRTHREPHGTGTPLRYIRVHDAGDPAQGTAVLCAVSCECYDNADICCSRGMPGVVAPSRPLSSYRRSLLTSGRVKGGEAIT